MSDPDKVVLIALDEALAERVMRLFDVLMADESQDGRDRFMLGLAKVLDVHEWAVSACTAMASSGS